MLTTAPSTYAHLPTFSAVIDVLASGLGIARNKDDALTELGSFCRRIDAYSGSRQSTGLEDRLLELLAGSNAALRSLVQTRLRDTETELTNARAYPLITEATEAEGLRCFIETWAAPWMGRLLADARLHPESVLNSARILLEVHAASPADEDTSYIAIWKAEIKRAIPEAANASEFRSVISKIDKRSQRKLSSIDQDINNLRLEMQAGRYPTREIDVAVEAVRSLYIAGMATMRLCAMAGGLIPERELLSLVTGHLLAGLDKGSECQEDLLHSYTRSYWSYLDPDLKRSNEYDHLWDKVSRLNEANFDILRADLHATSPSRLLLFLIDYAEGFWLRYYGHNDLAKPYFKKVVTRSSTRQLGGIAAHAASILIALEITEAGTLKFEALNPLIRVRIDNMPQLTEMHLNVIPTPFSEWSPRPQPSVYDAHLMQCVAFFNSLPRAPNVSEICNPLRQFDASIDELIAKSRQAGAKLAAVERRRPAIVGTSVKPYQALRDHLFYRRELFGANPPDLPGMDAYCMLPEADQRRLLRFIDPDQFKADLQEHDLGAWRHPSDPP